MGDVDKARTTLKGALEKDKVNSLLLYLYFDGVIKHLLVSKSKSKFNTKFCPKTLSLL